LTGPPSNTSHPPTLPHSPYYDGLNEANAAVYAWIQEQGLVVAGPPWEVYVTDPGEVPDPQDWRTEIFWPVE
jgi:AraC family transcriptional regulator